MIQKMRNMWPQSDKSRKSNILVYDTSYSSQPLSSLGCIWNKTMTHLICNVLKKQIVN